VVGSGLCHSDYHVISGDLPSAFPIVLGHEASGVVEAVGSDVRGLAVGDHVVTCTSIFCGYCADCQAGHNHLCSDRPIRPGLPASSQLTQTSGPVVAFCHLGGFAEEMVVHRNAVTKLPEGMPLDIAALLGCAVTTGVGAATEAAQIRPGSSVAVIGCGGVGLNVVQGARLAGAAQIIAVDLNPAKLELAKTFGATHGVRGGQGAVEEVVELTKGGVDFAFEVIGVPAAQRQGYLMLRNRGTLTLVGVPPAGADFAAPGMTMLRKELRVIGSLMGSVPFQRAVPAYAQLYLDGRLKLDELISQRIRLEDINRGYDQLIAGETARSLIVFDS
jgi:S-(hydroxymethyl)glutathione dehydrogenase/alcohol dehydrogenase